MFSGQPTVWTSEGGVRHGLVPHLIPASGSTVLISELVKIFIMTLRTHDDDVRVRACVCVGLYRRAEIPHHDLRRVGFAARYAALQPNTRIRTVRKINKELPHNENGNEQAPISETRRRGRGLVVGLAPWPGNLATYPGACARSSYSIGPKPSRGHCFSFPVEQSSLNRQHCRSQWWAACTNLKMHHLLLIA